MNVIVNININSDISLNINITIYSDIMINIITNNIVIKRRIVSEREDKNQD